MPYYFFMCVCSVYTIGSFLSPADFFGAGGGFSVARTVNVAG